MAIRNFCIDTAVENRKTKLSGGGKGFDMNVTIKDKGEIAEGVRIVGIQDNDGKLHLKVYAEGECVYEKVTQGAK